MREVIEFQPNVPVQVTLQYAEGKICNGKYGPRFMFSTTDDKLFFTNSDEAQLIRESGARPKVEPIQICKRQDGKSSRLEVSRIGDPPRSTTPDPLPAPATQAVTRQAQQPQQPRLSPSALSVAAAFGAAYDGLAEATSYIAQRGMAVQFSPEDLRATALTVLIQSFRAVPVQANGGNQPWRQ